MRTKTFFYTLFLQFLPLLSFAAIVPCGPGTEKDMCELCDFFDLFGNLVEFVLLVIVPPIATLLFVYAGIIMFTANGDPNNIKKAKEMMINTIVGLIIIYGAHIFISFLLSTLGIASVQWPNIQICP
jgi:hypothetical protein